MYGLKDFSPHGQRYKGPRKSVRDVNNELLISDVDPPEIQARAGLIGNSLEVGVQRLFRGHSRQINVDVLYRSDYALGILLLLLTQWLIDV